MPVQIDQRCWGCHVMLPRSAFSSEVHMDGAGKMKRTWHQYCRECVHAGRDKEPPESLEAERSDAV